VVVEVERVLGVVRNGEWKKPVDLIASLDEAIVGHEALETHPIEIHLAFDLPKSSFSSNGVPTLNLPELFEETDSSGLTVGEWFLFDKGKFWSYRSSRFLELDSFEEVAHDDHALMSDWLYQRFGSNVKSWTLIEQILGLWKTGESGRVRYSAAKKHGGSRIFGEKLTLPQLGRWEQSFSRLDHFWGVVPNFLGDTNPEIETAMLTNLRNRKTIYTYFLYSYADLQRLKAFRKTLETKLKRNLSDQIRPVILTRRPDANAQLSGEYFIANPNHHKCEGYRLERNSGRHFTGGTRLSREECQVAVAALSPLLNHSIQGFRPEIILRSVSEPILAIAFTDLEKSVETRNKTPRAIWDKMMEDYDQLIATETSRAEGEVIKALGDGYLLKFPSTKAGFDFAVRVQKGLDRYNATRVSARHRLPNQRIALDCGQLRRVQRSHGSDLEGRILSRCARVMELKRHYGGHILMTRPFRDQLSETPPTFGVSTETIKSLGFADLSGFGPVELFELIWRDNSGVPIKALRRFGPPRKR